MTVPRNEIFIAEKPHFYHCWSRYVRRAFLCGFDILSEKSFKKPSFFNTPELIEKLRQKGFLTGCFSL